MAFCTNCGNKIIEGEPFCRKCGKKVKKKEEPKRVDVEKTLEELRELVDYVADQIKKELSGQVAEIERRYKEGRFSEKEFEKEAVEIKARLLSFTED